MSKFGVDLHSLIGGGGIVGTVVASGINVWAGAAAGLATAIYMSLRAAREYVKFKQDLKNENQK